MNPVVAWARWQLRRTTLRLDLERLPRPVAEPGARDVIICGVPRSGTALATAMVFQPPVAVAVMEPWDALRLPPAELFASLREELATGTLRRGRLDVAALRAEREVRWCRDGESTASVEAGPETVLAVKFPTLWQYLGVLPHTRFLVCVRDPLEVVTSCRVEGGRLAHGLDYDVAFNRQLNRCLTDLTDDPVRRRVAFYDAVGDAVLAALDAANVHLVRYERWTADPAGQLADIAAFVDAPLGPPTVDVRRRALPAHEEDRAAVARWCRTGEALGYPVR